MRSSNESPYRLNRRAFLGRHAGALGTLALAHLLETEDRRNHARGSEADIERQTAALLPTTARPRARSVISLFQHGGPSQMDLFDPKPALLRYNGKPYPGQLEIHFNTQAGNLLASPFRFSPRGQSGMVLSELLPHTAGIVDELTLIRSMTTESVDHEAALRLLHTGKILAGRPTWGSWVVYALGSENHNLPSYVVLSDPGGLPVDGVRNWSSGWLPAIYQGTPFRSGKTPVLNLETPRGMTASARDSQLCLLDDLNRAHLGRHRGNSELEARITNFEIAARMQTTVPEAVDLSSEPVSIRRMYGLGNSATHEYATRCLIARRLVERGVRFVQLFLSGQPWDTHSKNAETLKRSAQERTSPPQPWFGTSSSAACLMRRSSSGRASSAGCLSPRAPMAATTTAMASHSGWPAVVSDVVMSTARPTSSATPRLTTSYLFMTFKPRSFSPWASTTAGSLTPLKGALIA